MKKIFRSMILLMVIILTACQPGETEASVVFKTIPNMTVEQYDEDVDFMEGVIIESTDGENLNHLVTVDLSEFSSQYVGSSVIYYRLEYQGKSYEKFLIVVIIPIEDTYYTVSFNTNGGTAVDSILVLTGSTVTNEPTSTKTGYQFDGWYLDEALTIPFEFDEDIILSSITLYAKWTIESTNEDIYYTITFNSNGGSSIDPILVLEGSTVNSEPTPTQMGYQFDGWYSDESLLTPFGFNEDIVESDIILYAKWTEDPIIIPEDINLNIYYLNDLHGAILSNDDSIGMANIANLVLSEKETHPENTIFISGGDMLQGQVISNYFTGASVIDLLNQMELDAFVIGNHEFDWGLDQVLQYFDGENPLQANYPLLGANVYSNHTNQRIDVVEPYTIIERSGLKIAIIGTIGYGLESSISYPRVQPYYFYNPSELTGYYAEQARLEGADIVLAVNHHDDSSYNNNVAQLSGNKRVDAIFNGHTHYNYVRSTSNQNRQIHTIQSGANGSHVGKVSLTYNTGTKHIQSQAINLHRGNEIKLTSAHPTIEASVNAYEAEVHSLLYDSYMRAGEYMSRGNLAIYIAKLMQEKFNADVGIHNFGGTRTDINNNEDITYSKLFQISPFDNQVILATVKGSVLKSSLQHEDSVAYRTGLSYGDIIDNLDYVIATNDYIFYGKYSPYKNGTNIIVTEELVLDLFVEVIENLKAANYTTFYLSLPIIFNESYQKHHVAILPRIRYSYT